MFLQIFRMKVSVLIFKILLSLLLATGAVIMFFLNHGMITSMNFPIVIIGIIGLAGIIIIFDYLIS